MDLIDRIRELSSRIPKQREYIQTEEATKNAMVMPFITLLGYDVFNPLEVTPELNADIGLKKGEKVDYAILKDGKPIILFECKHHSADLSKEHASQLYRYFSVTDARFGVLTNGVVYWFYTDLEAPNKLDSRPFFEFNLLDVREQDVEELKKFTKSAFDLPGVLSSASELKFTREIKQIMTNQFVNPTDDFIKYFAAQVYPGRMTQVVRDQFAQATRRALAHVINDQINDRLKSALAGDTRVVSEPTPTPAEIKPEAVAEEPSVVTTAQELEGYYVIKSILRESIDVKRLVMRDVQTYCSVLLDDNNRRPVCRLWLNGAQWYIGLFDNDERKESKIPIEGLDGIYAFADRLRNTAAMYADKK